jgi:hypothetical protein
METVSKDDGQEHRDKLRMSAWLHQMSAVWGMHRYAAMVEAACLSGWYFLSDKGDHSLAAALLLVGSTLLYMMIITIRRQSQMLNNFNRDLVESGVFHSEYPDPIGLLGGRKWPFLAHQLARLFVAFLIMLNFVLIGVTVVNTLCVSVIPNLLGVVHLLYCFPLLVRRKTILLDSN